MKIQQLKIFLLLGLFILSIGQVKCQDSLTILIGYDLKIDKVKNVEKLLSQSREPRYEISQFNKNNPYFKFFSESILNNPYYPYTEKYPIDSSVNFYREGRTIPITSNYHYNIKDSIILSIIYDWEIGRSEMNINKRNKLVENTKVTCSDFEKQYDKILDFLINIYGKPSSINEGIEIKKTAKKKDGKSTERSCYWDKSNFVISLNLAMECKRIRLNYHKKME